MHAILNLIETDLIPVGRFNRPGRVNALRYITIHETGNYVKGADALAHAHYLKGDTANAAPVSWHYTVDETRIVRHIPDEEDAYHAADGSGDGNRNSIGIELCVNADGDFEQTLKNGARLVQLLMEEHEIPIERVVQHNHWSGKNCPYTLRTEGRWEEFLALCRAPSEMTFEQAVDTLAQAGLINSPDYWKGEDYSLGNVRSLILKWALSL